MLFLAVILGVYNSLFASHSTKAKNELIISLPNILRKLLVFNIFLSLLTSIFILSLILKTVLMK